MVVAAVLGAVLASGVSACTLPADRGSAGPRHRASTTVAGGSALAALERLPVKGRAPMTGYDRAGSARRGLDADRNGCDTRNDMLAATSPEPSSSPAPHGCVVLSGTLPDPYTGTTIGFVRGRTAPRCRSTTSSPSATPGSPAPSSRCAERAALANDPLNLLAGRRAANEPEGRRRRGDLAAAEQGLPVPLRGPPGRGEERSTACGSRPRSARRSSGCSTPAPGSSCPRTPAHRCSRPCGSPTPLPHPLPPPARAPSRAATRPGPPVQRRCTGATPATPRSWTATATASPASDDRGRWAQAAEAVTSRRAA